MGRPRSQGAEKEVRPQERFIRFYGNGTPRGFASYAPTPRDFDLDYVGPQRVPRLWKPGIAGWASIQAPYWPPDGNNFPYMGGINGNATTAGRPTVPHIYARTLGRADTRSVTTGATLRPATLGRVPPVIVPRARFAR